MLAQLAKRNITRSSISRINQIRCYTDGSTGAPRPGGGSDAFQQREKANEEYWIRQQEAEKLKAWKDLHKAKEENKSSEEQARLQKDFDDKSAKFEEAKSKGKQ